MAVGGAGPPGFLKRRRNAGTLQERALEGDGATGRDGERLTIFEIFFPLGFEGLSLLPDHQAKGYAHVFIWGIRRLLHRIDHQPFACQREGCAVVGSRVVRPLPTLPRLPLLGPRRHWRRRRTRGTGCPPWLSLRAWCWACVGAGTGRRLLGATRRARRRGPRQQRRFRHRRGWRRR